jgi:predicted outer membrane protein
MNLTKQQVELMDAKEVDRQLRLLAKTYKLDKPLSEWMTPELWDKLDDIINTLAYLEDRKQWLVQFGHLQAERT